MHVKWVGKVIRSSWLEWCEWNWDANWTENYEIHFCTSIICRKKARQNQFQYSVHNLSFKSLLLLKCRKLFCWKNYQRFHSFFLSIHKMTFCILKLFTHIRFQRHTTKRKKNKQNFRANFQFNFFSIKRRLYLSSKNLFANKIYIRRIEKEKECARFLCIGTSSCFPIILIIHFSSFYQHFHSFLF